MNHADGFVAATWKKLMDDPRMSPANDPMPLNGKRLIHGGFAVIMKA